MRRNNSSSNKLAAAEQGQKQQPKMPKPQPWLVLLSQRRVALAGALVAFAVLYTLSQRSDEAKENEEIPCDVLANPRWAPRLPSLVELSLRNCGLTELPSSIGQCTSLKKLDLGGNDLTDLPMTLAKCTRLEILFVLGSRRMTSVPKVLAQMTSLTRLGLKSNGLTELHGDALPPHLIHAIFTDNQITTIDEQAWRKFSSIRKLMLANNRLTSFTGGSNPSKNLASLELVRLANNDLQSLPDDVLRAPRLAWVALAGNPRLVGIGSLGSALETTMAEIDFSDAVALGKGASGSVRSASFEGTPCAVKELLETSSDGAARDELAVHARVAGATPSTLIKTLAIIRKPPAVVMERLTKNARDLAKPPTIIEVTRDRYEDGERYAPAFAVTLVKGLAEALRYLHSKRVAHGDVYGHNTLVLDSTGAAKLGDFGASFYYGELAPSSQKLIERVEVRAFGVLCAEIATRVVSDAATRDRLLAVADDCLRGDAAARPSFEKLVAALGNVN